MAMQLGGGTGVKSDINVTPLVDVMLVLLIIMMIVAPMLQKGVDVRLPVAANSSDKPETQDQTVLAIKADKTLWVNGVQVREAELRTRVEEVLENKQDVAVTDLENRLRTIFEERKDKTMFIAAAGNLRYGDIVAVIDAAKGAGVEKVGIVTEGMRRAAGASGAPGS